MKRRSMKKTGYALLCLCAVLLLTAFTILPSEVTLDVRNHPSYRYVSIEEMLADMKAGYTAADLKYNGKPVQTVGYVSGISFENRKIELRSLSEGGSGRLSAVFTDKELPGHLSDLKEGDLVRVYGRAGTVPFDNIYVNADAIEKMEKAEALNGVSSFPGGKSFSDSLALKRNLARQKLSYRMPSEWSGVEKKLVSPYIEGYQYHLNEIPGTFTSEPEMLFVFYFDYEKNLVRLSDRSNVRGTEKAIIENILRNEDVDRFPMATLKSAGGLSFSYYDTSYTDTGHKYHNVEFVFTPCGKDGICCLLYVYGTSRHKEDIIYLMDSLTMAP